MYKVSVIIPVYNSGNFLKKCLLSVEKQDLADIEIIIINDGSTDDSSDIILDFIKKSTKRIKYIDKKNEGQAIARNVGIQNATGEYIAFLDSDDYIDEKMYSIMYEMALTNDYDLVECNFWKVFEDKSVLDKENNYESISELITKGRVVPWNKLIKRSLLIDNHICFPEGIKRYEDIVFFYRLAIHITSFILIDNAFCYYVQRPESVSSTENEYTNRIFNILDMVEQYYKEHDAYEKYRMELEYNRARYLLCSSMIRICKVSDRKTSKTLVRESWIHLNKRYPYWKKNPILKNNFSSKNIYMRTVNSFTLPIYFNILRFINYIKKN